MSTLPLRGIKVLEFSHLIMGPIVGMILADLGAEVIKVEPAPAGDSTRRLGGFTSGFFDYFNRNKKSLSVDLKTAAGIDVIRRLLANTDVVVENFGPGTMDRLGLGEGSLRADHPRLVYCALKGFLDGPYQDRTALDEVVQFMGGLAYMTGPPGQPLRAGTSVVDLTGGTMAVIAILAALRERDASGTGTLVQTGLFESVAFLMGQHMAAAAVTGETIQPMPARQGGWAVYRLFEASDQRKVFIAITSDMLWRRFCAALDLPELADDSRLATNDLRLEARPWLLPLIERRLAELDSAEVLDRCARAAVPCAPVATVEDLFDDPHLNASGSLAETVVRGGRTAKLPLLPFRIEGHHLGLRTSPPGIGEHTAQILADAGMTPADIADLVKGGIVRDGQS